MNLLTRDLKSFRARGLGNRLRGWWRRMVMHNTRSLMRSINEDTERAAPHASVTPRPQRYYVARWTPWHGRAAR